MKLQKIAQLLSRPKLTVPESEPLSPCVIKPYKIDEKGNKVENKGYIPVSLLVNAIKNKRMKNIAVAGNYGVGKSSIIKTAERKLRWRCRYNFIDISLASLLVSEHEILKEEKRPIIENKISDDQIEYSILQQILYHDRPQKTPKSQIRRIHKTRWFKPIIVAFIIVAVMAALVLLIEPKWINIDYYISESTRNDWEGFLKWGPFFILCLGIFAVCWSIGRRFTFKIKRVANKNVEVEVGEEPSVFNTHMDEIVYFFESTRYDVVVFEDLDRFKSKEVLFYKLRELNTILNNSRCLKRRKISFIYAVRDQLFGAIDRVKFFDYIVTVIPVVNSLNSYDKLKECIHDDVLFNNLGDKELYKLCDYFQDMRLLLNIVNEFNQYAPLLNHEVMTEKVLFGLVVYKNYVPSDFSLMYNKGGVVSAAIENADLHRLDIIAAKKKEIEQHKAEIDSLKGQLTDQIFQLRKRFLERGKMLSGFNYNNGLITIEGLNYSFDDVAQDNKLFDHFRKGNASYYLNALGTFNVSSFETIEKHLKTVYDDEITKYRSENDNAINEIKKHIEDIETELESLPNTVQGIYEADPDCLDEELSLLNDNDSIQIAKFLILNGYLDRYYQDYISYFYPNTLTYDDRIFVMRAGRHEGTQYEYELNNIAEVLKRFDAKDFVINNALLNLNLVREIYNIDDYAEYRDPVCQGIKRTKNLEFLLLAYHSMEPVKEDFYSLLLETYDYWDEIANRKDEEKDDLREIYIKYCSVKTAKSNIRFSNWLSNNYSFLSERWDVITTDRLIKVIFKECSPRFRRLNLKSAPKAIVRDIYDNGRYSFNEYNVKEIAKSQGVLTDYSIASFTTICKLNNAALMKMVKVDWVTALSEVFPATSVHEDEEIKVGMINDPSIPDSALRTYLSRQRDRIKHADKIKDERLNFAYDNSLVVASWKNLYYYAIKKGFGLPLRFIEKNAFKTPVMLELNKVEEKELVKHVVFTDKVGMSKYKEMVPLFNIPFESIDGDISRNRIKYLVDSNYLAFNKANFNTVKEYGFSGEFLTKNVDAFDEAPEKYTIDSLDAIAVLNAEISKSAKCEFVRAIRSKDLSPTIDLVSLIRPFLLSGEVSGKDVSPRLLVQIATKAPDNDIELLGRRAILSSVLNDEEIKTVLYAMGGDYRRLVSKNSKTSTIPYNYNNIRIVKYLTGVGILKDFSRTGDSIVVEKML